MSDFKNILVKEVNWLGDIVMSLPALRAIRQAFPKAQLSVLIKQELASFFDGAEWIDQILPYRLRRGLFAKNADRLKVIRTIQQPQFDLAILFTNSFDSALWPFLARIPQRIGYARNGRGGMLTRKAAVTPALCAQHQVHYYLQLLAETLGVQGCPEDFRPDVSPQHREKMNAWLAEHRRRPTGPLIALAPAAAYGPAKEWPVGHYAELIDALAEKWGAECVLVGSPGEKKKALQILEKSKAGALIAAGQTSVGEALALLSLCAAFAGNDSGSMHVAGALGLPTAGIFGSTRADRTGPLGAKARVLYKQIECNPCLKRTCRFEHYHCLSAITPPEVASVLGELTGR